MDIRAETPRDYEAIHTVTEMAFRNRPYAGGDEQDVIVRLRRANALTKSLVAIDDGELIGQITFSPATNADRSGPWFALGPVSVTPKRQNQGVGSELIRQGIAALETLGALGCILTGNPAYYRRFGFELSPQTVPEVESAEYFMLKPLSGGPATGTFAFHSAFYKEV